MKFLDVKTDFAFKKVFGSEGSKDILMSFLNSLVLFSEGGIIEDVTIVDSYQIGIEDKIQGVNYVNYSRMFNRTWHDQTA